MNISVVIPAYNEEQNIMHLYHELTSVLSQKYEIIFVDDGSTDSTFKVLQALHNKDKKVKAIRFQKNFKKAAALSAGLKEASGDIIITMDADLQDNPHEIPRMLMKLNQGHDLVVGWKQGRKDSLAKIISSKIFNSLIRLVMKTKVHDSDCNFRVMRKEVAKSLHLYGGLYRYIPSLANSFGFKVAEVKVLHRPRKFGKSKYGPGRLYTGFFDLITVKFLLTYNKRPMHLFAFPGLVFGILGFIIGAYLAFIRLFLNQNIGDRPLLLLSVLLIVLSMQFISLGLIGELLTSRREEKYLIKEKLV